jgi:hypothetical protein
MDTILPLQATWNEAFYQFAHEYWSELLSSCGANVTKMALAAGFNRSAVYENLKRFNVALPPRESRTVERPGKPRPPFHRGSGRGFLC